MGCHLLDLPFWALELRHPAKITAEGPEPNQETAPTQMRASWEFSPRKSKTGTLLPAASLHWHDGGLKPPQFKDPLFANLNFGSGVLFVGNKGMLVCDYGRFVLLPEDSYEGFTPPPQTLPSSPGHYREWVNAIRGEGEALCDFEYSGALTETVLLGNVAYRAGEPFSWDAKNLRASSPRAQSLIAKENRPGWF